MRLEPHDAAAAALYATDVLRGSERRSFESHLSDCELCQTNLAQLCEDAAALAFAIEPVEPPPALRGRILAAAYAEANT